MAQFATIRRRFAELRSEKDPAVRPPFPAGSPANHDSKHWFCNTLIYPNLPMIWLHIEYPHTGLTGS